MLLHNFHGFFLSPLDLVRPIRFALTDFNDKVAPGVQGGDDFRKPVHGILGRSPA